MFGVFFFFFPVAIETGGQILGGSSVPGGAWRGWGTPAGIDRGGIKAATCTPVGRARGSARLLEVVARGGCREAPSGMGASGKGSEEESMNRSLPPRRAGCRSP